MSFLNDNDLIFFDDCLYSQFYFIKEKIKELKAKNVDLNKFKLKTNIYVFPYAYDLFPLAYKILNNSKFNFIFAEQYSKRIQIEDIIKNCENNYNGI